ncbi:hypothetical protein KIW84_021900 [Lathyrus oleraceus]|uniref:Uncharacterized protein n=1 Tax=Pisum sativum TaxID=3888 RepID=A0A9D4YEV7_PEA|nr:hypothetical protein KIW84_021900 [Pisum sativum]
MQHQDRFEIDYFDIQFKTNDDGAQERRYEKLFRRTMLPTRPSQVNAATFLLAHLRIVSRSSSGSINVGGLITSLVVALGLEHELEPIPTLLGSTALDINVIMLPDPIRIDMRDNRNWIFEVEDSEDDDANQFPHKDGVDIDIESIWDEPPPPPPHSPHIPVSPAHITRFAADHFVGTSSRH